MRYFVGFLVTIGLIIILIIMLFGGDKKEEATVPVTTRTLVSYASTDAEVSMFIDGPVNAESEHQQIQVTVGRDTVTYEQFKGYNGEVVDLKSFDNTEAAYGAFLQSLSKVGFTQGDANKDLADERGYCPLGSRYVFSMEENNESLQRYWITTCNGPKTYLGISSTTIDLFKAQVPNYSELTQNVSLN